MAQLRYDLAEDSILADADWYDESADLADVLRDALDDAFSDAGPEEMDDALANVLESMSPAEAFNFTKALSQIQRSASQIASDPAFAQIAGTVLPIAGGALGTVIGGPVGTALGTSLGTAAAKALPGRPAPRPPAPGPLGVPTAPTAPAVAGGSAAAAQGLVLSQQPDVLKGLLALAMGQHGQKTVSGVPVASLMSMLSSVFGQAAADADELMYAAQEARGGEQDEDYGADTSLFEPAATDDRSIYTSLLAADNDELAEALGA